MPGKDLRLLSLDGGGVRGLSSLQILKQLMETIDPISPPKPCDYFNMIGGTSTGGCVTLSSSSNFD
jgi:patatin-like phospholipase/acyl hydrolase